jgi:hypothetical protein
MMTAVIPKEKEKGTNPMDARMTAAQVARRKFKSTLPRKPENRSLSTMQALGETFTLLDQFRSFICAEKQSMDAGNTVYAAIAYSLPDAAKLASTLTVPDVGKIGTFCDAVMGLGQKNPTFLGVVFVQVDPDAEKTPLKCVSFVVPFVSGPDAEARLLFAQREELSKVQKVLDGIRG